MAYRRKRAFHNLVFEGELAGLNIRVRYLDSHGQIAYQQLDPPPTVENPMSAVPLFLEQVDRWDLEQPDGSTARATLDDFLRFDSTLIRQVVTAWLETVMLPYPASEPAVKESTQDEPLEVEGPDLSGLEPFVQAA